MKYLTPELKAFYLKDFIENVIPCTDDYWALDNGIKEQLININKSQDIQTLYSKKCVNLDIDESTSYIIIAITKDYEPKLNRFIKAMKPKYKTFECFYSAANTDYAPDPWSPEVDKMSCMSNNKHFGIGHYVIQISSRKLLKHEEFWKDLEKYLVD